jgi:hypothetical protein
MVNYIGFEQDVLQLHPNELVKGAIQEEENSEQVADHVLEKGDVLEEEDGVQVLADNILVKGAVLEEECGEQVLADNELVKGAALEEGGEQEEISLQDSSPISMTTNDLLALTPEQFDKFQSSRNYILLCHNAPKPEPCPVTIKDGEQYCNWGVHDVFKSFNADEFEAAMIYSIEPSPCMKTPLMDDFEAHAIWTMNPWTQSNVPCTTTMPETIILMPVPTNNNHDYRPQCIAHERCHGPHIEYPDWTKFVSSMNHEQYEELRTYNNLVKNASFFANLCPMEI